MRNEIPNCGECGYELTGLADQGNCPECGNRYNMRFGTGLIGDPNAKRKSTLFLSHIRTLSLVAAAMFILFCTGVFGLIVPNREKLFYSSAFIIGVILLGAITSYVYEKNPD